MKEELLTPFEEKILKEIVRPALSHRYESFVFGTATAAQDLNFVVLLRNLRRFYERNDGESWNRVLLESDKPEKDGTPFRGGIINNPSHPLY